MAYVPPCYRFSQGHGDRPTPGYGDAYTREERTQEELFADHTAGIDFSNYENVDVTIVPPLPPCDTFAEMGLAAPFLKNIERCRYTAPTPVQRFGIPAILSGADLMACAQTGSGKTAAYLLPTLHMIHQIPVETPYRGGQSKPSILVLAPTRELAVQIYDETRKFTDWTRLTSAAVYGGADLRAQARHMSRGCALLVATPGRLLDFVHRSAVTFCNVRHLILDEADRMLDMGFEPQIRELVDGHEARMPRCPDRQTLLFSATFPREIQQLAREFLKPQQYFLTVGRVGSTTENITQVLHRLENVDKHDCLLQLLNEFQSQQILVFTERKNDADALEGFLHSQGHRVAAIHGGRSQRDREWALSQFKARRITTLLATDVASRGLDIPDVALVVQFDLPSKIDSYVHRIGRTGRAGKKGRAVSLFTSQDNGIASDLMKLMQESNQDIPDWLEHASHRSGGGGGGYRGKRGRGGGRGWGGSGRGRARAPYMRPPAHDARGGGGLWGRADY